MIWVNAEKLIDLKNGDGSTNPSLLGIDQSMLDNLGIALTVVNLGILLKHGLYTAANKLANGRNIAALDDTWTKFKLENVKPPKPKEAPAPPKTKTKTKEPTKDGPGVNRQLDELDDASKSRTKQREKEREKEERERKEREERERKEQEKLDTEGAGIARKLDEEIDAEFIGKVKDMKKKLPSKIRGKYNFGYAEVNIEGLNKNDFFAHSGISKIEDIEDPIARGKVSDISIEPVEKDKIFTTKKVNKENIVDGDGAWDRSKDTEFKILNEIATSLGNNRNAVGKIKLYTDLDCCPSCNDVIRQFKAKYPNISIEVIYKTKGGTN